jgi:uncharacterized DUF497 family protein/uncharacterized protein (DUF4415 family)
MRSEWDENKNRENRKKHGVSFEIAMEVFDDPFSLTSQDRIVEGEERLWTLGCVEDLNILVVVHTVVDQTRRSFESSPPEKRPLEREHFMKKLTDRQRRKALAAIAAIPDEQIDTSDIPELTDEQLSNAVRGEMYRPVKKPVTMRLDADVIHWLKSQGPGYQTKANRLLRAEMLRSLVRSGKHRQSFATRIAPKHAERGTVRRRRG